MQMLCVGGPWAGRFLDVDEQTRRRGWQTAADDGGTVVYDLLRFTVLDATVEVLAPSDWTRKQVRARLHQQMLSSLGQRLVSRGP